MATWRRKSPRTRDAAIAPVGIHVSIMRTAQRFNPGHLEAGLTDGWDLLLTSQTGTWPLTADVFSWNPTAGNFCRQQVRSLAAALQ